MNHLYKKLKSFVQKSLEKDSVLLVLSVLLALFVWGYITNNEYPDIREYITDVAIDYDDSISGTPAEAEGYKIYDAEFSTVDIYVGANRKYLGFLNRNMFTATISAENYSGEQPVNAKIKVSKTDENDFECDYGLKDPKKNKVKVYFYKEITRTIDVTVKAPDITAAEGYKLKNLSCDSLSVTGPEPYVNMISSCVLNIQQKIAFDARKSIPVTASLSNLTFLNENGEDINKIIRPYITKEQFRINKPELTVMVNISEVKNLDITYKLTYDGGNLPAYFNPDFITDRLSLSTPSITVSSDDPTLENMTALSVATDQNISLSSIGLDFATTFDIRKALESYPALTNETNINSSYVTFDSTGLEEKIFDSCDKINIKNPYPQKYNAVQITQQLTDIKVIGPASDIEKITVDDLQVEIDLSKSSVSDTGRLNPGLSTYKALITLPPKYRNVWVYGEYTVAVEISEVPESENGPAVSH